MNHVSDFVIDRSWSLCYFYPMRQRPDEITRLVQKIKRLSTLIEVNGTISFSLDLDDILKKVVETVVNFGLRNADCRLFVGEKVLF